MCIHIYTSAADAGNRRSLRSVARNGDRRAPERSRSGVMADCIKGVVEGTPVRTEGVVDGAPDRSRAVADGAPDRTEGVVDGAPDRGVTECTPDRRIDGVTDGAPDRGVVACTLDRGDGRIPAGCVVDRSAGRGRSLKVGCGSPCARRTSSAVLAVAAVRCRWMRGGGGGRIVSMRGGSQPSW